MCVITFFKTFIDFLNKNAYMDVAITSEGFCSAASRAMGVMVEEGSAMAILNGAQAIFIVVGMGLISGIPAVLTFLACKRMDTYSNEQSLHYIAAPKFVALASMIVSAIIGVNFMLVFDTVGDTILYCFAMDMRRQSLVPQAAYGKGDDFDSEDSEEDSGFFGWLFGSAHESQDRVRGALGLEPVVYAPPKLRKLVDAHKHLMG
mmetsp:Transcript_119518/g.372372  ORF Transcript_119518/g.372372 Transcript_119518/m.372372 type:complete len:204 (-) Transcript_119518:347-958(-)